MRSKAQQRRRMKKLIHRGRLPAGRGPPFGQDIFEGMCPNGSQCYPRRTQHGGNLSKVFRWW
jgi:hypothetical protein